MTEALRTDDPARIDCDAADADIRWIIDHRERLLHKPRAFDQLARLIQRHELYILIRNDKGEPVRAESSLPLLEVMAEMAR